MPRRVKHKKFIVMVLMLSFLSKKLPYQKTLHVKRNVLRLSRTIMEDHQIIMPRSQQQQVYSVVAVWVEEYSVLPPHHLAVVAVEAEE